MHDDERHPLGLVLTGGGARGAYQAGALSAIAELLASNGRNENTLPFPILSGASAGGINVAYLAANARDFGRGARGLMKLWQELEPKKVFRTDTPTLMRTAGDWIADLGLGSWIGTGRGRALLDTAPLRELVTSLLDVEALHRHVEAGDVRGVAVTATNYETGLGVTFFEGQPDIEAWTRVTRIGQREKLGVEHILASAAIPIFFPAVDLGGDWYADGCIRLSTPLSPAIRMGARKILAIAVRHNASGAPSHPPQPRRPYPTTADTAGVLLNALFLDALEADVERAMRINQTLRLLSPEVVAAHETPLVPVSVLVLRPSVDPASLVVESLAHFPATVRHLFRGLGASDDAGWDLLSYLAFEHVYTSRLSRLGYEDTMARASEVLSFLSTE
jgi:NTE family protein